MHRWTIFVISIVVALLLAPAAFADEWVCPMRCFAAPAAEPGRCHVCGMALVRSGAEVASIEGAESKFLGNMPGISRSLFGVSVAVVALLWSAILLRWRLLAPALASGKRSSPVYRRFELTQFPAVKRMLRSRFMPFALQVPTVVVFALVVLLCLFGASSGHGARFSLTLIWNLWWMSLVFLAFFGGTLWCTVCPWMALPDWAQRLVRRLRPAERRGGRVGHGLPWPRWARNLWPATLAFLLITWTELVFEAGTRPKLTGAMALALVCVAAVSLLVFERKGFCRYLCPVGRVTGVYAMTGLVELRRKSADSCVSCRTKDCYRGNDRGLPCPTSTFMGALKNNSSCTLCMECVKTCPHDNIALNLRAPGADLLQVHKGKLDEAALIGVLFLVSFFHGYAMTPLMESVMHPMRGAIAGVVGHDIGRKLATTVIMLAFFLAGTVLFVLVCALAWRASGGATSHRLKTFVTAFAYPLLIPSLSYHFSHNLVHVNFELSKLWPFLSELTTGVASQSAVALLPLHVHAGLQCAIVVLGFGWGASRFCNVATSLLHEKSPRFRAIFLMTTFSAAITVFALYLLLQPMRMMTA